MFELRGLPNRWVTTRGLVVLRLLDAAGSGIVCRERHKKEVTTYLFVFIVRFISLSLIIIFARIVVLGRWRRPYCFGNYIDRARPEITIWVIGYPRLLFVKKKGKRVYVYSFQVFLLVF
jgi:hypothetical protein